MTTILDRIRAYKLDEIAAAKAKRSQAELEAAAQAAPAPRGFAAELARAAGSGYGLIAEIKKASPSRGLIRDDFDPAALARAYQAGGATCLSVLTDGPSFQGAPEHLTAAHAATTLPCLRKDFLFDPWQVLEARAWHADCILIIMAAVSDAQAVELEEAALALRMDTLVEVHTRAELERTETLKTRLIGINNRDLHSFAVDLGVTRDLARRVREDRLVVSESGLGGPDDLAGLAAFGVRCFLIGESLMREADVEVATRRMLASPLTAPGGGM
jgi:indole-3-glycerol phosphate synthase